MFKEKGVSVKIFPVTQISTNLFPFARSTCLVFEIEVDLFNLLRNGFKLRFTDLTNERASYYLLYF